MDMFNTSVKEEGVVLEHIVFHYFIKKIPFQVSLLGTYSGTITRSPLSALVCLSLLPRRIWLLGQASGQLWTKYGGQGYWMNHFPPLYRGESQAELNQASGVGCPRTGPAPSAH